MTTRENASSSSWVDRAALVALRDRWRQEAADDVALLRCALLRACADQLDQVLAVPREPPAEEENDLSQPLEAAPSTHVDPHGASALRGECEEAHGENPTGTPVAAPTPPPLQFKVPRKGELIESSLEEFLAFAREVRYYRVGARGDSDAHVMCLLIDAFERLAGVVRPVPRPTEEEK